MSPTEKRTYVVLEPADDSPRVEGVDFYVTTWSGCLAALQHWLEDVADGQPVAMTFTTHHWTEAEHLAWCEENEVEMED